MSYDVIIIGGGPAGSASAILLSSMGHRVLLLEKSRFPREKLCGEFITPECLGILERLRVMDDLIAAGAKYIKRWTFFAPDGRGIEFPVEWIARGHSYAISLTRARMDLILLDRARETGTEVREEFYVSPGLERKNGTFVIDGRSSTGTIERFSSPVIIDASGRNGAFSSKVRQKTSLFQGSRLFGCKIHLRNVKGLVDRGEMFFFNQGYGGLTYVENDEQGERTNLCFLTTEKVLRKAKGDRQKLLELTLLSNPAAVDRLKSAEFAGEWLGTGPITYGRQRSMNGVLAIGDAGAFIDPFTGSGILMALSSGEIAAGVINNALQNGNRNIEFIAEEYYRKHKKRSGMRFRASSALRSLVFQPALRNLFVTLATRHNAFVKFVVLCSRRGIFY